MKRELFFAALRHLLTFGGGLLITKGYASTDEVSQGVGAILELIGAIMTLSGVIWSIRHKMRLQQGSSTVFPSINQ